MVDDGSENMQYHSIVFLKILILPRAWATLFADVNYNNDMFYAGATGPIQALKLFGGMKWKA